MEKEFGHLKIDYTTVIVWKPTNHIRWVTRSLFDDLHEKVLQQLWVGDRLEEEWRDIETIYLD
jgi:hypothetical protein